MTEVIELHVLITRDFLQEFDEAWKKLRWRKGTPLLENRSDAVRLLMKNFVETGEI